MNTIGFNNSLRGQALHKTIVDINYYISSYGGVLNPTTTEELVAHIKQVRMDKTYMEITFQTDKMIRVFFDGHYEKYNSLGISSYKKHMSQQEHGHFIVQVERYRLTYERFIAIAYDYYRNALASDYQGWHANVMDSSGSVEGQEKYDIPANFHPNNIEWCLAEKNSKHRWTIERIYQKTNHVYAISANDRTMYKVAKTRNGGDLLRYWLPNHRLVK